MLGRIGTFLSVTGSATKLFDLSNDQVKGQELFEAKYLLYYNSVTRLALFSNNAKKYDVVIH